MLLSQRGRDNIHFVTVSSNYTRICTLVYVGFMLTIKRCYACLCVESLGASRLFRFELRYAKATRRHLCQLDDVFVVYIS